MADVFSKEERSRIMAKVRGKNTKPELLVRSTVHRMGFRFRLHRKDLPGRPDLVLAKHRKVIFVHGCFWHGHEQCSRSRRPTSNKEFWREKLVKNKERDEANIEKLRGLGWTVLVIWECETKRPDLFESKLKQFLCGEE